MEWIYIGVILNSIIASEFPTEEACLGHKAILEKQKIAGECVKGPPFNLGYPINSNLCMNNACLNLSPAN